MAVTVLGMFANWTDILPFGLTLAALIVALGLFGWLTRGSKGR